MSDWIIYLAGLASWPVLKLAWWVMYLIRFAIKDTVWAAKCGLKPQYSKWRWLYIFPKVFFVSMWQTATSPGVRLS